MSCLVGFDCGIYVVFEIGAQLTSKLCAMSSHTDTIIVLTSSALHVITSAKKGEHISWLVTIVW